MVMLFSQSENANTEVGELVERPMVDLEVDDGLAVVTIDRPHARNAISLETMHRLDEALDGAVGARALVIKGAGDKAFVSGGGPRGNNPPPPPPPGGGQGGAR